MTTKQEEKSSATQKKQEAGLLEAVVCDNVLSNLFGMTNTGGAVEITTTSNTSLVASARTYSMAPPSG